MAYWVLPAFDMINHCNEPNLAMEFCDEKFQVWATKDIGQGEELFVSYKDSTTTSSDWDENDAIWMLVRWGIPIPRPPELATGISGQTEDSIASQKV